jgi:hypothetical protein
MQTIFDTLASSKLIFILSFLISVGLVAFIVFKFRLIKKGIVGIGISILLLGFLVYLFSIYFSGDYGYVNAAYDFTVVKNKICFIDNKKRAFTPYALQRSYDMYRLHIINAETGERIYRSYIGLNVKWLKNKENIILYETKTGFDVFDIDKKAVIRSIDNNYLEKKFNELSAGIASKKYIKDFIIIDCKNGRRYYYEPFSDKIVNEPTPDYFSYKDYSFSESNITLITNGREKEIFRFKPKNKGESLKKLYFVDSIGKTSEKYSDESFIGGICIGFFPERDIIIIKSYETTDRERIKISALDNNLKTLWKIDNDILSPVDFFAPKKPVVTKMVLENGKLFFAISGFVYSVDSATGKIIWRKRF